MSSFFKFQVELRNPILALTVISTVFLAGIIAPDAKAQDFSIHDQITPFNLFYLAYQGYFKQDGIDGGNQAGSVDPEVLVRAAVKHHRLPEQILSSKTYLYQLSVVIDGFNIGS